MRGNPENTKTSTFGLKIVEASAQNDSNLSKLHESQSKMSSKINTTRDWSICKSIETLQAKQTTCRDEICGKVQICGKVTKAPFVREAGFVILW